MASRRSEQDRLGEQGRASSQGDLVDPVEWLRIEAGAVDWEFDAEWLRSSWRCIWNEGCLGIEAEPAPDARLGCCSVGAELLDEPEAMRIAALAATIEPERMQYHAVFSELGPFRDERAANTRVVDGACVFLNRPGFDGPAGCALHAEALRVGDSPIDWKPAICWQLPIRVERTALPDGREQARLRRWARSDWGPDGATMAWCCTEGDRAYVGSHPVIDSLAADLLELFGQ